MVSYIVHCTASLHIFVSMLILSLSTLRHSESRCVVDHPHGCYL